MNILIAPNPFKDCATGMQVCDLIEHGFSRVFPEAEYVKIPMADGGDGTLDALVSATHGRIIEMNVTGPLHKDVRSRYGILGDGETAVIEMALASGIALIADKSQLNPMGATSFGTGQLINAALDRGVKKIIVGIGGSATNDGGIGMAQALGVKFFDAHNVLLPQGAGGQDVARIARIDTADMNPQIVRTQFLVASDVTNPLSGPEGAAPIFGPQKGATPDMIRTLDDSLERYGELIFTTLQTDIRQAPGGGAAGGMGAALMAFAGATLRPGIELVMEANKFEDRMRKASLVITGEGQVDRSTIFGKAPAAIAQMAGKYNVPVLIIGGGLTEDAHQLLGKYAIMGTTPRPMSLGESIGNINVLLPDAAARAARLMRTGMELKKSTPGG